MRCTRSCESTTTVNGVISLYSPRNAGPHCICLVQYTARLVVMLTFWFSGAHKVCFQTNIIAGRSTVAASFTRLIPTSNGTITNLFRADKYLKNIVAEYTSGDAQALCKTQQTVKCKRCLRRTTMAWAV